MSAGQHTPGPWLVYKAQRRSRPAIRSSEGFYIVEHVTDEANARLIASCPELLAAVEAQYIELADIRNEWPGRNTAEGQQRLSRLRDLICKATGREAQDVQDDYTSRTARTGAAA